MRPVCYQRHLPTVLRFGCCSGVSWRVRESTRNVSRAAPTFPRGICDSSGRRQPTHEVCYASLLSSKRSLFDWFLHRRWLAAHAGERGGCQSQNSQTENASKRESSHNTPRGLVVAVQTSRECREEKWELPCSHSSLIRGHARTHQNNSRTAGQWGNAFGGRRVARYSRPRSLPAENQIASGNTCQFLPRSSDRDDQACHANSQEGKRNTDSPADHGYEKPRDTRIF